MTALALADAAPELVRALVLVDITPGVDAHEGRRHHRLRRRARELRQLRRAAGPHDRVQPHPVRVVAAAGHPPQRRTARRRHLGVAPRPPPHGRRRARREVRPSSASCGRRCPGTTVPLMLVRGMRPAVGRRRRRRGRAASPPARRPRSSTCRGGPQRPGRQPGRAGRADRRLRGHDDGSPRMTADPTPSDALTGPSRCVQAFLVRARTARRRRRARAHVGRDRLPERAAAPGPRPPGVRAADALPREVLHGVRGRHPPHRRRRRLGDDRAHRRADPRRRPGRLLGRRHVRGGRRAHHHVARPVRLGDGDRGGRRRRAWALLRRLGGSNAGG